MLMTLKLLTSLTAPFVRRRIDFRSSVRLLHSTSSSESSFTADSEYKWLLQFDGGSRGNPGVSGAGAVIYRYDSGLLVETWHGYEYLGDDKTNNFAEYRALILGLKQAVLMKLKSLKIQGDSQLAIHQLNDIYKVRDAKLIPLHAEVKTYLEDMSVVLLEHIRREYNSRADELSNIAMNSRESGNRLVDSMWNDENNTTEISTTKQKTSARQSPQHTAAILPTFAFKNVTYVLLNVRYDGADNQLSFITGKIKDTRKKNSTTNNLKVVIGDKISSILQRFGLTLLVRDSNNTVSALVACEEMDAMLFSTDKTAVYRQSLDGDESNRGRFVLAPMGLVVTTGESELSVQHFIASSATEISKLRAALSSKDSQKLKDLGEVEQSEKRDPVESPAAAAPKAAVSRPENVIIAIPIFSLQGLLTECTQNGWVIPASLAGWALGVQAAVGAAELAKMENERAAESPLATVSTESS